ncbi:MAG: hypothetical protein QM774_00245 [Gordonia sp. (in: high G+C Gram-positive bacteria)]|uniref:hypothetical protein n=1 Tax=Gordonia sp. (in: high G+C Gram-positive bacteria) TaxID=84139 RepID=UPI0039E52E16
MKKSAHFAVGLFIAGAGVAGAAGLTGAGDAHAAAVCGALPGQSATMPSCSAESGATGLSLAITDQGGQAWSTANGFSGPAAIAIGKDAQVHATGVRPGLAIGIAGPGATVVIDGKHGPTCTGSGPAFAGDFQTLRGCWR